MFGGIGSPSFGPTARVTAVMIVLFILSAIEGLDGMMCGRVLKP